MPDFIGLKGDTSDNIPGVPGIGDKTAAELLQRFGSLEDVLASVDQISGAKRKQNLTEHAEDARVSKRLATMVRDVPVDLDLEAELAREPDRSRLREVFREWELRDPLRRLEEALDAAEAAAIPRPEALTARTVAVRAGGRRATSPRLTGAELALVAVAPEIARGRAAPARGGLALRRLRRRADALAGEVADPAELVAAAGERPVIAHDAKALGEVPANLAFDTEVAAYLLDPARRGYPLDELAEERGMAVDGGRPAGRARGARPRARRPPARADPRARARGPAARHRAAARARAARDREGGHQARHRAGWRRSGCASAPTPRRSSARSGSWPARSS